MFINTLQGMLEETELEKVEVTEEVPCGTSISTRYLKDGVLVREDQKIVVDSLKMTGNIW